jgi:cytidine deaminase
MKNKKTVRASSLQPSPDRLLVAALKARERAGAPYSNFKVGTALLTRSGKILGGANVESASYGLTWRAERVARFKALTEGEKKFVAVAVVARAEGGAMPCGASRQFSAEYAAAAKVFVADSRRPQVIREFSVRERLPGAFLAGPRFPRADQGLQLTAQRPRPPRAGRG